MAVTMTTRGGVGPVCAAVLLGLALLIGGGGSPAPLSELILQLVTALVFGAWLAMTPDGLARVPRPVWWISGLVIALHLVQLVPLPPSLWQHLPGRSGQVVALDLVQAADTWRPLSLSPHRTVASLLCAVAALAMLIITSTLDVSARWGMIAVSASAGLMTMLVGAVQMQGTAENPLRFFHPDQHWLTGFQANRNSTADLILIAMLATTALIRFRAVHWITLLAGNATLAVGLFLTGSRTGLALVLPLVAFQFLILRASEPLNWRKPAGRLAATFAGLATALALLREQRVVATVLGRFTLEREFRPELWRDAVYAGLQYWPAGSGQGTFVPVMIAAERLEVLDPTSPNRAHNDFLELAIEGGLPALIVLLAIGAVLVRAALHGLRQGSAAQQVQVLFGSGALSLLCLHSLVDYPLRSMALAALAAVAAGMLFPAQEPGLGRSGSRKP